MTHGSTARWWRSWRRSNVASRAPNGLISPVIPPTGRTFEDGQVERQRDEDQVRARAEGLKVEQNAVEQEAKRLETTPRGVVPGIGVLALFGVIGIVFALYEMTCRPIEA